ncbi:MAG: hypothetical protein RMK15_01585 [Chloroflexota bacterium]|jgi:Na+/H+ antiporter NhaA|nr:hypothetical protein [Dehalococcoidia bacterium]MDW8045959.1 hypothetical protein [Chloroflexota bacterium]
MWSFLRRQALIILAGFVVTFLVYLFVRFNADDILVGMAIGAGAGVALAVVIFLLERQFPEQRKPPAE